MHKENGQLDYPEAFIPEFFGDTVLVKASRIMGLETVVEGIMDPRVQPSA
jgi:hypothetical protein